MIIPNICGANVGIIPKQGKEMPVYHNKKGMGSHNPYLFIIGCILGLLIHLFLDSLELVTHVEVVVDTSQSDHVVTLLRLCLMSLLEVRQRFLE